KSCQKSDASASGCVDLTSSSQVCQIRKRKKILPILKVDIQLCQNHLLNVLSSIPSKTTEGYNII
ncbi:hypothetical protein LEMLEM_LOCUS18349, partial [Lemmus lemmus]